jgi:hypothetical protein
MFQNLINTIVIVNQIRSSANALKEGIGAQFSYLLIRLTVG